MTGLLPNQKKAVIFSKISLALGRVEQGSISLAKPYWHNLILNFVVSGALSFLIACLNPSYSFATFDHKTNLNMSGDYEISSNKFASEILPQLALHYRREALYELEGKCPWLKVFKSVEPDFNEARKHFFSDGSACMLNLEKYIELMRLATANEDLTYSFGVLYIIFMAKLHAVAGGTTEDKKQLSEDRDRIETSVVDSIQSQRKAIGKRSSAAGLVDSSDSFLEAGQQIVNDSRTQRTEVR